MSLLFEPCLQSPNISCSRSVLLPIPDNFFFLVSIQAILFTFEKLYLFLVLYISDQAGILT